MRKTLASQELEQSMSDLEKNAWQAFQMTVEGFLGCHWMEDYVMVVSNLIEITKTLVVVCLKITFLHSLLDFFRDNLEDVSDEHRERFHQDV